MEEGRRRRNIKISARSAALGYSVIKLKHLIKLKPLITGCCHVGVIYSNCGSRIEEQMFQSCWCHGMSSKRGGGGAELGRGAGRGSSAALSNTPRLPRRWGPLPGLPEAEGRPAGWGWGTADSAQQVPGEKARGRGQASRAPCLECRFSLRTQLKCHLLLEAVLGVSTLTAWCWKSEGPRLLPGALPTGW